MANPRLSHMKIILQRRSYGWAAWFYGGDMSEECSLSSTFPNTPQLPTPITEGNLIDERHKPNNRKTNTTQTIAQLSLQSEGVFD
jgi:hypothetical protein